MSPVTNSNNLQSSPERNSDMLKSSLHSSHHRTENVGIVKGVPKQIGSAELKLETSLPNKINDDTSCTSSLNSKVG